MSIFRKTFLNRNHKKAVKETLASRTSTGRGRHRLRAPSGWTLAHREHSGAGISKHRLKSWSMCVGVSVRHTLRVLKSGAAFVQRGAEGRSQCGWYRGT